LSIFDKFLNELNRRVQAVSANVDEINDNRNKTLEIENLLFKKEIDKNNITGDDLTKLNLEEFESIMSYLEDSDYIINLDSFISNVGIVELYKNISLDGHIIDAEQYEQAISSLNATADNITKFLKNYTSVKTQKTIDSADNVEVFRSYLKMFNAGELTVPIFDMAKFNRVVDICGFSPMESAGLKKAVGQANIMLVMQPQLEVTSLDPIQNYRDILKKKFKKIKKFEAAISEFLQENNITQINADNAPERIKYIAEQNPHITLITVQNVIICLLMMSEIARYDEFLLANNSSAEIDAYVAGTVQNLEDILALAELNKTNDIALLEEEHNDYLEVTFSNVQMPEDLTMTRLDFSEANITEEVVSDIAPIEYAVVSPQETIDEEAQQIINWIEEILFVEAEFLRSINPDDYTRYAQLLEMVNSKNTNIDEKHRLAMIIETLGQQLKVFQITAAKFAISPEEFSGNYISQKNKIKEYLEVYNLLKNRNLEEENKLKVIHLTNKNSDSVLLTYMDEFNANQKQYLSELLTSLSEKTEKELKPKRVGEYNSLPFMSTTKKSVTLYYAQVNENIRIVILGLAKSRRADNIAREVISDYILDLQGLAERCKSVQELRFLMDEQAEIESQIANYLGVVEARSK
jgi:hypothetical protein